MRRWENKLGYSSTSDNGHTYCTIGTPGIRIARQRDQVHQTCGTHLLSELAK